MSAEAREFGSTLVGYTGMCVSPGINGGAVVNRGDKRVRKGHKMVGKALQLKFSR